MNTGQIYMSRITTIGKIYFFMNITRLLKGIIDAPTISKHIRPRCDRTAYKWDQIVPTNVRDTLHSNTPEPHRFMHFNSNYYYSFSYCSPAAPDLVSTCVLHPCDASLTSVCPRPCRHSQLRISESIFTRGSESSVAHLISR